MSMLKVISKNAIITIFSFYLLVIFGAALIAFAPRPALATYAPAAKMKPQVTIGDMKAGVEDSIGIEEYIAEIYKYAIGAVGILATVVMMIGGIVWITAGGNAAKIGEAKAWIGAALSGLVLMLTSYVILNIVNPDLVKLKKLPVRVVTPQGVPESDPSDNPDVCSGSYVGATCDTTGYCTTGGCQPCKQASSTCSGAWTTDYECCNGDCVDNPGIGTGNSCN